MSALCQEQSSLFLHSPAFCVRRRFVSIRQPGLFPARWVCTEIVWLTGGLSKGGVYLPPYSFDTIEKKKWRGCDERVLRVEPHLGS